MTWDIYVDSNRAFTYFLSNNEKQDVI